MTRTTDRLARLEAYARAGTLGMSADEIDAAAQAFDRKLSNGGMTDDADRAEAGAAWRLCVETARSPYQRVWANAEPEDFRL